MRFKTPLGAVEAAALDKVVPAGREEIVDAAFTVAAANGIDPWLLLGLLNVESAFGKALVSAEYKGRTVWTGDFIPRPASAGLDAYLAKYPLPGAKRVSWVRPKIGTLQAFGGPMWVPAHDLRVAKWGEAGAKLNNGSVAGGLGWGWTAFQLDWRWHPEAIGSGAMEDAGKAVEYAINRIIKPNIARARKAGLTGDRLLCAVVAAYNSGEKAIEAAAAGRDPAATTVHSNYVTKVLSVARSAGRTVTV